MNKSRLNKKDILRKTLGFKYKCGFWDKWHLRSGDEVSKVQSVLPGIKKYNESMMPDNIEVLKPLARGQSVLRVRPLQYTGGSFIAKVFILRKLKHKIKYNTLKYDQFAFAEAANLIIAAERGLNVPEVYGYGCIYEPYGLISKTIVIMEDLADCVTIGELLKLNCGDRKKCAETLHKVIPVFAGLYGAGCNNVDINLGTILLGRDVMEQKGFILDFEYAQFYDTPNLEILMFNAAFFANRCKPLASEEIIIEWLHQLLDAVNIKDTETRIKLIQKFDYYRNTKLRNRERRSVC
jgi:hypothetical protein